MMCSESSTFGKQLVALLRRNVTIKWRQKRKLAVEVFMPLYFIVILWLIRLGIPTLSFPEENEPRESAELFRTSLSSVKMLCIAPNSTSVNEFVENVVLPTWEVIMPPPQVQYFNSEKNMEEKYFEMGNDVPLGIIFTGDPAKTLNFTIRSNPHTNPTPDTSVRMASDGDCRDPKYSLKSLLPGKICSADQYVFSGTAGLLGLLQFSWIKNITNYVQFPTIYLQQFPKTSFFTGGLITMRSVLPLFLVMAMNNFIPHMLVLLVGEKEKKLKESMLVMGTSVTAYWFSWFLVYCALVLVTTVILTVLLSVLPLLQHTSYLIIGILLFLYGLSLIMFGYAIVPFFDKARPASMVGAFAVLLSSLAYYIQVFVRGAGEEAFWALSLISPAGMGLAADQMLLLDTAGQGVSFSNLWEKGEGGSIPVAGSLIMLSVDIVLYGLIAYYLDSVWPSEYGTKRKPWFCFQLSFWRPRRMVSKEDEESEEVLPDHPDVEPVPSQVKAKLAVRIRALRKMFKSFRKPAVSAVNGISLDMYEGQITAILGHNGAGKTTLINVLTGLTAPSGGRATICGLDVSDSNDLDILRKQTGVCPQHDVLFEDLTPREHLDFFGRIKGFSGQQLENEIQRLLMELQLEDKANSAAKELSGGQKRKLSVAIALIGDSKIIFLDEPTAGMDPYSRRHLWNLLKSRKENKVVLLTTHFMDEADLLADRKAVVSKGRLQCCGSSMFLKNKFGIGYHLTMAVELDSSETAITSLVKKHVPKAECDRRHGREIAYVLPREDVSSFPSLFAALEGQEKALLGISSYGVSMTTLEEVFLHLGMMEESEESENPTKVEGLSRQMAQNRRLSRSLSQQSSEFGPESARVYGSINTPFTAPSCSIKPSAFRAFVAVTIVRARRLYRDYSALICVIILPLLLTVLSMTTVRVDNPGVSEPKVALDAGFYNLHSSNLLYANNSGVNLNDLLSSLANQTLSPSVLPQEYNSSDFASLLHMAPHFSAFDVIKFQSSTNGKINLNITIRFNDTQQHSIPVSLNMLMNSLLSLLNQHVPQMQVWMHPFPKASQIAFNSNAFVSSMLVGMVFALVPAGLVVDMVNDREVKARSLLRLNGLSLPIYFMSYFAVLGSVLLFVSICLLVLILIFQLPSLSPPAAVGTLVLFLALYWMPALLFAACFSYVFDRTETSQSVFANVSYMMGFIPFVLVSVLNFVNESLANVLNIIFSLIDPPYLPYAALYYINVVYLKCQMEGPACQTPTIGSYFTPQITMLFVGILVHVVVLLVLLVILDVRSSGGDLITEIAVLLKIKKKHPVMRTSSSLSLVQMPSNKEDEDVVEERNNVEQLLANRALKKPVVIVQHLRKIFNTNTGLFHSCQEEKPKTVKVAVSNLSFAVHPGEVFGLLGPNGAGKTTTMRLMVTEEHPTHGHIEVAGHDVASSSAFREMGYCPQHDALWKNVTVREHLECYAAVRGIVPSQIPSVVDQMISGLKLEDHVNKQSRQCSGGTKRKLSFALSLIGAPQLVLMDEPSTGLDPQARRFLWDVVAASFTGKKGAVLTTHSMEEADALSTRVGIMVRGGLRCIGATQHLKDKYGGGYMLEIRCKEGNNEEIEQFAFNLFPKAKVEESFADRIVLAIPREDVVSLAEAFKELDQAKQALDIVEYSLSQTTLEQVFLHFAKQQEEREEN